jgi:hypothetical protein
MARDDQPEPSTGKAQLDMFGAPAARSYDPDPESVRAELMAILAKAKAAPAEPWNPHEASLYRVIFPQMANWLPTEEAKQLCLEFEAALARLEAA